MISRKETGGGGASYWIRFMCPVLDSRFLVTPHLLLCKSYYRKAEPIEGYAVCITGANINRTGLRYRYDHDRSRKNLGPNMNEVKCVQSDTTTTH